MICKFINSPSASCSDPTMLLWLAGVPLDGKIKNGSWGLRLAGYWCVQAIISPKTRTLHHSGTDGLEYRRPGSPCQIDQHWADHLSP